MSIYPDGDRAIEYPECARWNASAHKYMEDSPEQNEPVQEESNVAVEGVQPTAREVQEATQDVQSEDRTQVQPEDGTCIMGRVGRGCY